MSAKSSPRSSPLMQLFASRTAATNANAAANNKTSPTSASHNKASPNSINNKASPTSASSSPSTSSLLRSLSKCFDGGALEDAVLDHQSGVDDGAPPRNIHHWGPSHSTSSDDQSKGGGFTNSFNFAKASKIIRPTAQRSSSSDKTDPTAPITTSTKTAGSQQQLSLKTGMQSSPSQTTTTPTNTTPAHSQMNTNNTTTATTAALGGSGASAAIANFWNFAKPADSSTAGYAREDSTAARRSNSTNSNSISGSSPATMNPLASANSSPTSSPTSLLTSPAKAAAEAASAVLTMFESLSTQRGNKINTTPKASPKGSPSALGLKGIPEVEGEDNGSTTNHNIDMMWETLCGNSKNNCPDFQEFGFNAFAEEHDECLNESSLHEDEGASFSKYSSFQQHQQQRSQSKRGCGGDATTVTTGAASQEQNKGYEIRLKSTFSQQEMQKQQIKETVQTQQQQRQQPTLSNLPENDKEGSAAAGVSGGRRSSPPAPSAFGRTHPNRKSPTNHYHADQPPNLDSTTQSSRLTNQGLPFEYLSVPTGNEIERSVSELTMRSHGAYERNRYSSDSRRMAYYAVGRINPDNKTCGNRRCYFTGIGIPYGMSFYAGSVQQGPRTLVVFCLPSALGLPSLHPHPLHSYSKEDRDRYLQTLPEPDEKLLEEMKKRYPDPFETLPVQVRSPHCWRLFVKFCFFSGLPIAEGEMHYRVKSSVFVFPLSYEDGQVKDHNGKDASPIKEEITLSHEVMEAVNGEISAEILRELNEVDCVVCVVFCIYCSSSLTFHTSHCGSACRPS
ncbi:predicted protein [Thalassiosira pseudonana CCMP1335]|uniref:Uncharacterized protein n=1 Tax=Thalassiosira pseudonana TaxID=35128 RepID=B8LD69_THAPS|nr:predicted protein [Thalassiosira pseudonana CCMP1335]EED86659.1 predicted protein [Thalassiosira pseudonana CCMP1335]|eukprot:scaffold4545_cov103-Alexandrium_tamarense.AAC.33